MQLHGFSPKTQACYVGAVRGLAKFYGKSPDLVSEEELRAASIPYVMYGGQQFFERKEVKHVIAYMRVALNPRDDLARATRPSRLRQHLTFVNEFSADFSFFTHATIEAKYIAPVDRPVPASRRIRRCQPGSAASRRCTCQPCGGQFGEQYALRRADI